jgi:hypothetical protein
VKKVAEGFEYEKCLKDDPAVGKRNYRAGKDFDYPHHETLLEFSVRLAHWKRVLVNGIAIQ